MICPKCHSENRDSAKFCDECGHKFGASGFKDNKRGHRLTGCDSKDGERGYKIEASDSTAALPPLFNNSEEKESGKSNTSESSSTANSAKKETNKRSGDATGDKGAKSDANKRSGDATHNKDSEKHSNFNTNESSSTVGDAKSDASKHSGNATGDKGAEKLKANERSGNANGVTSDENVHSNSKLDLTGFGIFDERPPHSGDTLRMKRTNVRVDDSADPEIVDGSSDSKTASAFAGESDKQSTPTDPAGPRTVSAPASESAKQSTSADPADSKTDSTPASENTKQPTTADFSDIKTVSAPADKADARTRARKEKKNIRDMKKQERKARRDLQAKSKSKKKIVIPSAVLGVIVVLVVVGIAGYYAELWGGKTVPITAGMSEADAVYTLQQAGFEARVSKVKSDDTEGIVLMTDPKVGTRVAAGSEVVVHVAESRTIPEVVGLDEQAALVVLRENGYTNITDTQYTKTNEANEGQVIGVDPQANTKAKSSRAITLTVAQNYRVPDVYGMTEANATYTLREAGYYVYLNTVESEALQEGTVYSSDPQANTVLDKDKYVTIYIVQHRSSKLESLAREYLSSSSTVQIGGVTYKVDGVQSVEYQSNGVVNFTISGSPTTSFLGESITLSSRSVSGAITFNDSNEVIGLG